MRICSLQRRMAAVYLRLTVAILISIHHHRRRLQKMLSKKEWSNRNKWVRPTIADRSTAAAFQHTFLVVIIILFGLDGFSCTVPEVFSDPNQTSKMKFLRKCKSSILVLWLGSEFAPELFTKFKTIASKTGFLSRFTHMSPERLDLDLVLSKRK